MMAPTIVIKSITPLDVLISGNGLQRKQPIPMKQAVVTRIPGHVRKPAALPTELPLDRRDCSKTVITGAKIATKPRIIAKISIRASISVI